MYDERWKGVKADDVNTSKYRAMKRMNDVMHKLLENKTKLRGMINDLYSESESSDADGSSAKESYRSDDAMADDCEMLDKSKNNKKSRAGSDPPEKVKGKTGAGKEEQKHEEAPANSRSNAASSIVSEHEARSSTPDSKDGASKTVMSNSIASVTKEASIQRRGLEVSQENPLVLTSVTIYGVRLTHDMLTPAEAEAGIRLIWLMKRIREAGTLIKLGRQLLEKDIGGDIIGLHTMSFGYEEPEPEEPVAEEPAQANEAEEEGQDK